MIGNLTEMILNDPITTTKLAAIVISGIVSTYLITSKISAELKDLNLQDIWKEKKNLQKASPRIRNKYSSDFRIVLLGATAVGKTSLGDAILKSILLKKLGKDNTENRSALRTSKTTGRRIEQVELETPKVKGKIVELIDYPGEKSQAIEERGKKRSWVLRKDINRADLVLFVASLHPPGERYSQRKMVQYLQKQFGVCWSLACRETKHGKRPRGHIILTHLDKVPDGIFSDPRQAERYVERNWIRLKESLENKDDAKVIATNPLFFKQAMESPKHDPDDYMNDSRLQIDRIIDTILQEVEQKVGKK